MLQECMEVFRENFKQYSEQWVLDNYVPKDGTYLFINIDDNFSVGNPIEIKTDRKTGKVQGQETSEYQLISFLDYYSKLIEMNKPVDSTKQIHSNNFYAFFVKKESLEKKLTAESISGYYEVLKNPEKKYSKPKDRSLYELVEEKLGKVDVKQAERIENWVKAELKNCIETLHIDTSKKDYFKIFFIGNDVEQSKENIKREGLRYIEPNIFNKNDYKIDVIETSYDNDFTIDIYLLGSNNSITNYGYTVNVSDNIVTSIVDNTYDINQVNVLNSNSNVTNEIENLAKSEGLDNLKNNLKPEYQDKCKILDQNTSIHQDLKNNSTYIVVLTHYTLDGESSAVDEYLYYL